MASLQSLMRYMIVERFKDAPAIYARLRERGRLMPDGLVYVDSWIDESLSTCFQLMETGDRALLDEWIAQWSDLMEFEIWPVISSRQAAARV